jgi:hypothetical protein
MHTGEGSLGDACSGAGDGECGGSGAGVLTNGWGSSETSG